MKTIIILTVLNHFLGGSLGHTVNWQLGEFIRYGKGSIHHVPPNFQALLTQRSLVEYGHGLDSMADYLLNGEIIFDAHFCAMLQDGQTHMNENLVTALATRSIDKVSCVVNLYGFPQSIIELAKSSDFDMFQLVDHLVNDFGMVPTDPMMTAAYRTANIPLLKALQSHGLRVKNLEFWMRHIVQAGAPMVRAVFEVHSDASQFTCRAVQVVLMADGELAFLRSLVDAGLPKQVKFDLVAILLSSCIEPAQSSDYILCTYLVNIAYWSLSPYIKVNPQFIKLAVIFLRFESNDGEVLPVVISEALELMKRQTLVAQAHQSLESLLSFLPGELFKKICLNLVDLDL